MGMTQNNNADENRTDIIRVKFIVQTDKDTISMQLNLSEYDNLLEVSRGEDEGRSIFSRHTDPQHAGSAFTSEYKAIVSMADQIGEDAEVQTTVDVDLMDKNNLDEYAKFS